MPAVLTIPETVNFNNNVYNVTTIGAYAFDECDKLTEVTLPGSLQIIRRGAFEGCTNLQTICIPDSVTIIEENAFSFCTSLEAFAVSSENTTFQEYDGMLLTDNKRTLLLCPEGKTGSVTIPNTVTTISDEAFARCSKLTGSLVLAG